MEDHEVIDDLGPDRFIKILEVMYKMAVKIRMTRMGAKKKPFYRLVVADSRAPRDGKFIEQIGYYNPISEPAQIKIDEEKAVKWLNDGAQPTETVKALFKKHGVYEKLVK
jgi:small subunit ribosomal protein S16